MSYYGTYLKNLVAGSIRIPKIKMKPGHIVSFDYDQKKRRRIQRLVFILNIDDTRSRFRLVHGISLENIKWLDFLLFLKGILVTDTITLIKRKYELRGPFNELIDRPLLFYRKLLKPKLMDYDAYRTYKMLDIKNPKIYALNYSKLFKGQTHNQNLLIGKKSKLSKIVQERNKLSDIFKINTLKLKDRKYKQLVIERFGDEEVFKQSIDEINEMISLDEDLL
jgi:hypothetical protein